MKAEEVSGLSELPEKPDPLRRCPECEYLFEHSKAEPHCYCPWHGARLQGLVGHVLEGFKIERVLSAGGFGVVYYAKHVEADRDAVIKVLRPPFCHDERAVAVFREEAGKLKRINCTQIPQVTHFGTIPWPWLGMVYCRGKTLHDEIQALKKKGKAFGRNEAWGILRGISRALAVAHASSDDAGKADPLVHRDLKPVNVILVRNPKLSPEDWVRVIDWGLAVKAGSATEEERAFGGGTPPYMPPEQFPPAGDVPPDPLSMASPSPAGDVYSFGILAYELLSGGDYPYPKPDEKQITGNREERIRRFLELWREIHQKSLVSVRGRVPWQLRRVVTRCLEKDPSRRYRDGAALERALRPSRWGWMAAAAALMAASVVLAVLATTPHLEQDLKLFDDGWKFAGDKDYLERSRQQFYFPSLEWLETRATSLTMEGDLREDLRFSEMLWWVGTNCEGEPSQSRSVPLSGILQKEEAAEAKGPDSRAALNFSRLAAALKPQLEGRSPEFLCFRVKGEKRAPGESTWVSFASTFGVCFDSKPPEIASVKLEGFKLEGAETGARSRNWSAMWHVPENAWEVNPPAIQLGVEVEENKPETISVKIRRGDLELPLTRWSSAQGAFGGDIHDFLRDIKPASGGYKLQFDVVAEDKANEAAVGRVSLSIDSGPGIEQPSRTIEKLPGGRGRIQLECDEETLRANLLDKSEGARLSLHLRNGSDLSGLVSAKASKEGPLLALEFPLMDRLSVDASATFLDLEVTERGFLNNTEGAKKTLTYGPIARDPPLRLEDFRVSVEVEDQKKPKEALRLPYPDWGNDEAFCLHTKDRPILLRVGPGPPVKDGTPEGAEFRLKDARSSLEGSSLVPSPGGEYFWNISGSFKLLFADPPVEKIEQRFDVTIETTWGVKKDLPVVILYSTALPRSLFEDDRIFRAEAESPVHKGNGGIVSTDRGPEVWRIKWRPTDEPKSCKIALQGASIDTELRLSPENQEEPASLVSLASEEQRLEALPEGNYILNFHVQDCFKNSRVFPERYYVRGPEPQITFKDCSGSSSAAPCHLEAGEKNPCELHVSVDDRTGVYQVSVGSPSVKREVTIDLEQEIQHQLPPWLEIKGVSPNSTRVELTYKTLLFQEEEIVVKAWELPRPEDAEEGAASKQTVRIHCEPDWPDVFADTEGEQCTGLTWLLVPASDDGLIPQPFYISACEISWGVLSKLEGVGLPPGEKPSNPVRGLSETDPERWHEQVLEWTQAAGFSLPGFSQWEHIAQKWIEEPLHRAGVAFDVLEPGVNCNSGQVEERKGQKLPFFMPVASEPKALQALKGKPYGLFGPGPGLFHFYGNVAEVVLKGGDSSGVKFAAVGGHTASPWKNAIDKQTWTAAPQFTGFRWVACLNGGDEIPINEEFIQRIIEKRYPKAQWKDLRQ